ncbi:hypothetical protein LCGC14_1811100 [marine sediment metagenome]|uniref:JAB domain-containing protein n=1 Tax=marine sediment metagenome TaxID=412755 RepID=A0A0F9GLM3_9ZZZZ
MESTHRYVMSVYREDRTPITQVPADMDWFPAGQCARFEGIRRGCLSPDGAVQTAIEPVWHPAAGEPYVDGVRVEVSQAGAEAYRYDVPLLYFELLAKQVSAQLVQQSELAAGEYYRYVVAAYPCQPAPAEATPAKGLVVESITPPLPLTEAPLEEFITGAAAVAQPDPLDMPAILHERVLAEATELASKAAPYETGGILIGHLHRDLASGEIFLVITAQIPAEHTGTPHMTKLTFTPQTWSAGQAAIDLRGRDELTAGWWHSHTYMAETCKDCRKAKEGSCQVDAAFMSADDIQLHRTCFPGAYSIALVVGQSPCSGTTRSVFGWKQGMVTARGFHVLNQSRTQAADGAVVTGGRRNA